MSKNEITSALVDGGFSFKLTTTSFLSRKRTAISPADWTPDMHPAVSLLRFLMDNEAAFERSGGVELTHETIACMSLDERMILNLPPPSPYSLRLESPKAVSEAGFNVRLSWLDETGSEAFGLKRNGTLLHSVAESFLVVEPLFSLCEEVDQLNQIAANPMLERALDARMVQFERMKLALAQATGDARADEYLDRLTIHHATGLAIEPRGGASDLFDLVLFGDLPNSYSSPDNEEPSIERRPLLSAEHALKFRTGLFPSQGARSHYRLAEGVYAVVDAPVEAAMRVVQKVNASDSETRAAFKVDPRSFLIEEIEKAGGRGDILCDGAIIREPMGYGERVLGVQEWTGTKISFKIPISREWFPQDGEEVETYTIEIPGAHAPLLVPRADVTTLIDAIDKARSFGQNTVTFKGKLFPLTTDLEHDVRALVGLVTPPPGKNPVSKDRRKLLVLRAAENEEDLIFNAHLRDPKGTLFEGDIYSGLVNKPMPHQVDGIAWLRHAFLSGMPGVLLADDMGLGKTFQILAFLNWLRTYEKVEGRPILIVAPKKLLEVWLDEVAEHLGANGLGRPVLAYDEHLARLKIVSGKDGDLGQHTLDIKILRDADWVLTTYETLRDYHFSFGKILFRISIYDEAQKMKNMASLINNAAKCQQADFTILMTGTPIENSVMDLWTLLDVAWPGFLGMSGKDFAATYGEDATPEQLGELKDRIVNPIKVGARECPPVMLRRFKSGVLEGLPNKTEKSWRVVMSPDQVRAYDAAVANQKSRRVPFLQALQALRTATFHPELRMPKTPDDHQRIIAMSARFRALFNILDHAAKTDERVLVFVDIREGQRVLAELIRVRYRLRRHPQVINGDTSTKALKEIKADFQGGKGFEVLLLGPRSAGFGLTLTAANHVVHMNRWWNPAVEDQCSDRVYRVGQDKPVTIHLPIAIHPELGDASFDVELDALLSEKRALSKEIVVPTTMTEHDFRKMFAVVMGEVSGTSDALHRLDRMGWLDFEDWVASQFSAAGYQANKTPRSGDAGADIILRAAHGTKVRSAICQCKHRSLGHGEVDESAVKEVLRAREAYRTKYQWLNDPILLAATNGKFSLSAQGLAREQGVMLVSRENIERLFDLAKDMCR